MSYSPSLGNSATHTRMRTPNHISAFSGMCSVCSADCPGLCEIGLSAVRGPEAIYPYDADANQFASDKNYPLDFSHFSINGRVFGVHGCSHDSSEATYPKADIASSFGIRKTIALTAPIILPAMAKLNWKDYFSGAALAGILVVIGEDVVPKDKDLILKNGRVSSSPLISEMIASFREYERGYGDIVLQANYDDENLGVLDYAITSLGVKSVELKFGQAAKGIQGSGIIGSIEDALELQKMGYLVYPDPTDPAIAENYGNNAGPKFRKIGRLPMWDEDALISRVAELKGLGAEHICFKTGPFDPKDMVRILKIASESGVDMVTFDGAGGGTGNSPVRMMNEWGIPTVYMESMLFEILKGFERKNLPLPQVAVAGGFVMEDQIFKGLALGAPYVNFVGVGRAAMAAATSGKKIGDSILKGAVPKDLQKYGSTIEDIFADMRELRGLYGSDAARISTGAAGLYSYINRICVGLRQFMALNRKFSLKYIDRSDIYPLTDLAEKVTGLRSYGDSLADILDGL